MFRSYFYRLLAHYLTLYVRPNNLILEYNPATPGLGCYMPGVKKVSQHELAGNASAPEQPEYIVLNGNVHYEQDVQSFL